MTELGLWIDEGQNYTAREPFTCPYFDGRWLAAKGPTASLAYLHAVPAPSVGIYLADPWQWPGPPTDPIGWADWAYDTVQHKCAPGTSGDWPRVDLNYEHDDPVWLLDMLSEWRRHSPHRTTAFVVQAHKADVYASIAVELALLHVTVKPECYQGANMQRVESGGEVLAWQQKGVVVEPMYDASQLGAWWNEASATAYTQGRLP